MLPIVFTVQCVNSRLQCRHQIKSGSFIPVGTSCLSDSNFSLRIHNWLRLLVTKAACPVPTSMLTIAARGHASGAFPQPQGVGGGGMISVQFQMDFTMSCKRGIWYLEFCFLDLVDKRTVLVYCLDGLREFFDQLIGKPTPHQYWVFHLIAYGFWK